MNESRKQQNEDIAENKFIEVAQRTEDMEKYISENYSQINYGNYLGKANRQMNV